MAKYEAENWVRTLTWSIVGIKNSDCRSVIFISEYLFFFSKHELSEAIEPYHFKK